MSSGSRSLAASSAEAQVPAPQRGAGGTDSIQILPSGFFKCGEEWEHKADTALLPRWRFGPKEDKT